MDNDSKDDKKRDAVLKRMMEKQPVTNKEIVKNNRAKMNKREVCKK